MRLRLRRGRILVALAGAALAAGALQASAPAPANAASAPQLQVSGNKLVNASGAQVILRGVDRSGTEYSCVEGNGIFDGPSDQASITAIKSWGSAVNAVRVPLNEACWNGESYVKSAYSGANYRSAIENYVSLLNANGIVAVLDLHWTDGTYTGSSSGCSSSEATCQKPMPDSAEAIPFWTSVASAFKGNNAVVFDLFNEPYPERADNSNETEGWQCWLNGGSCAGISYNVAGMQAMVNAVRSTGANNVLMLGGLAYSNDLTQILSHLPSDPDHDLAASWHSYNFNSCSTQSCWSSQITPVAKSIPVIAGEIGENDCGGSYINPLTSYMDSIGGSYLAWAWNADFNCSSGPGLITDYTGTPTTYGQAYKTHLASVSSGGGGGGGTTGATGEIHAVGASKCLDVPSQSTTEGTQTDIWDCNAGSNQEWTSTSSGQLTVYSGADCLDASGQGTTAGTKVDIWPCNGGTNQQWKLNSNGTITGVQSGLCLDVTGASTADGALGELWTCTGGTNQQWTGP